MAIFRIHRKIYSTLSPTQTNLPNVSNFNSQQTNLLKNKQLNTQVKLATMRNDRQNKINQRKLAEIEDKKQEKINDVNTKSQELARKEKRDTSKVQTDLLENRPDLGKVKPAHLVTKLTTAPITRSVNK